MLDALDRMRIRFDEPAESSPLIPDRAWERAKAEMAAEMK
jgi:hypothetical protein